jgi:hypothetical protein
MFSMNRAVATISGIRRCLSIGMRKGVGGEGAVSPQCHTAYCGSG